MFIYFEVFGIKIPTYGLCMALAFLVCLGLTIYGAKRTGKSIENVIIIDAVILAFSLAGAKLLYIIVTYGLQGILTHIRNRSFAFLTESGFVYMGGFIGGVVGAFVGAVIAGDSIYYYEDILVPVIPIVHSIGRLGCFFAGCCHGFQYNGFGAVYYKRRIEGAIINVGFFPIQLVEVVCNITIAIILLMYVRKEHKKYEMLSVYIVTYCFCRFILEFFRGDAERGGFLTFSTSQWICAICMVGVLLYKCIEKYIARGVD